jgi:hypothetical protein
MANRIKMGPKWQAQAIAQSSGVFLFTAAILMASGPCLPQLCTDARNVLPTSCLGGMLPDVSSPISSRDVSVTEAANLEERTTVGLWTVPRSRLRQTVRGEETVTVLQ